MMKELLLSTLMFVRELQSLWFSSNTLQVSAKLSSFKLFSFDSLELLRLGSLFFCMSFDGLEFELLFVTLELFWFPTLSGVSLCEFLGILLERADSLLLPCFC
jgi:hypothetical protein